MQGSSINAVCNVKEYDQNSNAYNIKPSLSLEKALLFTFILLKCIEYINYGGQGHDGMAVIQNRRCCKKLQTRKFEPDLVQMTKSTLEGDLFELAVVRSLIWSTHFQSEFYIH